jgi:septum formation topological specificity factor MinE
VHHRACTYCAKEKIRMKKIPKEPSANIARVEGEKLMIDISWIKTESTAKNRYWLLIMDEYTNFLWSYIMKTKDEQVSVIIKHVNMLQNKPKVKVKYIRCCNYGEYHDIQKYLRERSPKMRCKFEFTAPDSPQKNGKIERKFATLYGRVRAILNRAEFTEYLWHVMWAFCSLQATRLDNILIRPDTHLSPYEMYHEETPKLINFLKAFGEIAIVKTPAKLQAKLTNRGITGIYLGPAEDHNGDTYTFWDPITKHVFESRSAIFLDQTYAELHKLDKTQIAKQVATITDELNEMFDEDEEVMREDIEDDYFPN